MADEQAFDVGSKFNFGLGTVQGGSPNKLNTAVDSLSKTLDQANGVITKLIAFVQGKNTSGGLSSFSLSPNGGVLTPGFGSSTPSFTPSSPTPTSPWNTTNGGNWSSNSGGAGSPAPGWTWNGSQWTQTSGSAPSWGWSGSNGGISTPGLPPGPPTYGGAPYGTAPSSGNGGNWGGMARSALGMGAVGLATFTANHYSNQFLMQSLASQNAYGSNFMPAAQSMFGGYSTGFSTSDIAQAATTQAALGGYVPGSAQYALQKQANQQTAYNNPSISASQAATAATSFQNPSTFNRLMVLGINPINKQGVVDINQLAQQILQKVPWYTQIKTPQQIAAELYDPAGGIYVTLQSLMANGMIPASSFQAVQSAIGAILRAQIHGTTPQQLSKLENQATNPGSSQQVQAQNQLKSMGIGGSLAQTQKEKVGATTQTEATTLGGFAASVQATTSALTKMREVINSILGATPAGAIVGGASGALGSLGGIAKDAGGWLLAKAIWSKIGGGGGGGAAGDAGGFLSGIGSKITGLFGRLNPFRGGVSGFSEGSPSAPSSGGGGSSILGDVEGAIGDALEGGGGAGGIAPMLSSRSFSARLRGSSLSARRGGRSPGSGGASPNQSQGGGSGGGSGSSGPGGSGISFIPPGPGLNQLNSETDFGPRSIGQGFHTGIDLMRGMAGATFVASAAGEIIGAGWGASGDPGYGNVILINHGGGYVTMYAHCSTINVQKGATVRQGQGIGCVGDTGSYSMGPHLHFELHINGTPVNPVPYLEGKSGTYNGPTPGGNSGSSSGSGGQGSQLGQVQAFANGDTYGSEDEVDALAGLISGSASVSTPFGDTAVQTGAQAQGGSGSGTDNSSGGGGGGGASYPGGGSGLQSGELTPAQAQSAAKQLLSQYGWGQDQFAPLLNLWNRESSWEWNATNPSSGAYGIPQSLPATKMAAAGPDWRTNALTQMRWGLGYIKQSYGSPANAWGHEEQVGWYDKGSWELMSDQLAMVHKGEMILPQKVAGAVRDQLTSSSGILGGGNGVSLTFTQGAIMISIAGGVDAATGKTLGNQIVDEIVDSEKIRRLTTGSMYGNG